jgi:predicted transcriptional regulator
MKTLQDAKEQIAETTVYKRWENIYNEFYGTEEYCEYLEQAAELYASQFKSEPEDLHSRIMAQWEKDFGSIHKDITMDAYTVSGFIKGALNPNS